MKKCYLICNAHIDPAWQWEWEEGASTALATFRSAADLLQKYDFVFCHNEALLYEWIREYDKELFEQIAALVKSGKWRIMGGWYLQPDCVMTSGESIVRQIMLGRESFAEMFPEAPVPTTAINFDSFGHCAGLPQILRKCGYDSYIFCRPTREIRPDLTEEYIWEGNDGAKVRCYHSSVFYLSGLGEAKDKILSYTQNKAAMDSCILLWGVGNHGGGPSRKDLEDIRELQKTFPIELVHSYPEDYFAKEKKELPTVRGGLVNFAPGCYTSMAKIKHAMAETENLLFSTEKLCSAADILGVASYPFEQLDKAIKYLLLAQFHDILPGSGIREVEEYGLRLLSSAQTILEELRAKAMFALVGRQQKAKPGTFPHFVFNPHPYAVEGSFSLEFMLESGRFLNDRSTGVRAYAGEKELLCQTVKERSTVNHDWRKRALVHMTLPPMSLTRVDCVAYNKERAHCIPIEGDFTYDENSTRITINGKTGRLVSYSRNGKEFIGAGGVALKLYGDRADSWALSRAQTQKMGNEEAVFSPMSEQECAEYCGNSRRNPIAIIEDGALWTEVECLLSCGSNRAVVRYGIDRCSGEITIRAELLVCVANKMIKLHIPSTLNGKVYGQTNFATEELKTDGQDTVSQRFIKEDNGTYALAVLKSGIYGASYEKGGMCLSLVRTPGYCCHYVEGYPLEPDERCYDHMDRGINRFEICLLAGGSAELAGLERKAKIFSEKPYALHAFPQNEEQLLKDFSLMQIDAPIDLTAFKKSRNGGYIVRLFNNSENPVKVCLRMDIFNIARQINFGKFEVKTFRVSKDTICECDRMEI